MPARCQLQYITDTDGNAVFVVIPVTLWQKIEPEVSRMLLADESPQELAQAPGPLRSFEELMQCWDFKYAYNPAVACPHCGAEVADWRNDPRQSFVLTNANIGGLLVFHCRACGTTIRQKHFRDHVAFEHTAPRD